MSGHWQQCICRALVAKGCWWWRGIGSGVGTAANSYALLGMQCLAWLALLGSNCSACVRVRPLMRQLALCTCGPGQRWGGGGAAALALLGLRWGQATDALACTGRSRPMSKMGEEQMRSIHLACAGFGLLDALVCTACSWSGQKWEGAVALASLGSHYWRPSTKLRGEGGSDACFACIAWLTLIGVGIGGVLWGIGGAARQQGFCRLALGRVHWLCGVVQALVVACWQGDGIVTTLAPIH